jgi:twitching motility two-component system response regulator PilH
MTPNHLLASKDRKTVLIVEDSATQAQTIRVMLEQNGLNVLCAFDGLSGLRKAQEVHPDLIVMDVNMPGLNGFQVVRVLKDDPKTADIPIVMLTSSSTPEAAITGLTSGAIDYIPKDVFAMSVLIETIRQMNLLGSPTNAAEKSPRRL